MKRVKYYNSLVYKISKPFKKFWFRHKLKKDKIIEVDDRHRGIGKTYMLIEKAINENIPIIVGNTQAKDYIKRHGNAANVFVITTNGCLEILYDRDFRNGVLIDETVDKRVIMTIRAKGIKIRGGFKNSYQNEITIKGGSN